MKNIKDYILESTNDDIYVLYMDDNTMVNYFDDEESANAEKTKLEKENKDNKCFIKKEKRNSVEK